MARNSDMHPRNPYRDKPPDFKALAFEYPEFRKFCQYVNNGKIMFDFREDAAVRCLTKTLLKKDFSLEVDLPSGHLVPRVPQKLNYCLLIDDLLCANNLNENVIGIDIGTGTSCIHALIGARRFGWKFVATDGDPLSVQTAHSNVRRNELNSSICVVHVNPDAKTVLMDVVSSIGNTSYTFCMCNPPFFDKPEADFENKFKFCEDSSNSQDIFSNCTDVHRASPHSITIASAAELFVEGGEIAFVNRIIDDSVCLRDRIKIYTTMLGRKQSVKPLLQRLNRFGDDVKYSVSSLNQGKTKRWMLAWTFVKSINFTALEKPVSINCSKPGILKVMQEVASLNGNVRRERPDVLIVEFRSATWTHQRARRRAKADLFSSSAKKSKLDTSSIGIEATLGSGDGKDSFSDAGNFVRSETFETANHKLRDNASQAYFPLPAGVIPQPVVKLRITVKPGSSHDIIQFEIMSGSKHLLYQVTSAVFMSRLLSRTTPGGACIVNKDDFTKAFNEVPKITISSLSDVKTRIDQAIVILSKSQEDWTKRMNQLKLIRSIVIHSENVVTKDQILPQLIRLIDCLELSVRDLRSQILREAAVTCSFIVSRFGIDAHQVGERCLSAAFCQVSVSTKVMATSGITLTLFIVQYVQTKQVFTTIATYCISKDKNQRRQLASLLEVVVEHWNEKVKKPLLGQICELIKSAISDADPETRTAGRKAFRKLDSVHTEEAERLYQSVDQAKQRMMRATDAASSCNSVNSERGTTPMRSKLSSASSNLRTPSIPSKFLAQRSASAIDTKQITRMASSRMEPRTSNLSVKSNISTRIDTSPGGTKFTRPNIGTLGPRTSSSLRSRGNVVTSQPGSRNTSPPRRPGASINLTSDLQRVKSNLGSASFVSSLSSEEAEKLQKVLNSAKEHLRQPSRTDDDEFLLPKRQKPKSPPKNALDLSRVEAVIRACSSTSANEKKEGIKLLSTIVSDSKLSDVEVKNTGSILNRLLSDVTNPIVLEAVSMFVQTHHSRLSEWLKLGLGKLFAKKGSEMMPNMKKQITATIECVLSTFDPILQLRSTCELMCDPIHLLTPKARVALLDYMSDLLEKRLEHGTVYNTKDVRATIMKMFSWMTDQRIGQMIIPFGEKVICSLFALNPADFSTLFNDFNPDYRDWAFRILQLYGHDQQSQENDNDSSVRATICNTAAQIEDFVSMRNKELPTEIDNLTLTKPSNRPLRSLTECNPPVREDEVNFNESFERLKLNSTTHLIDDITEQSKYVSVQLNQITGGSTADQYEGLLAIQTMLCEGSFTLWEHNFAKLLIAVFDVLTKSESDVNKKIALRVLTRMCTSQAARLFDSTEASICKVLDAAVNSKDGTMNVTADDCLKTLATHLPLPNIVNISKVILNQEKIQEPRASLVLKMLTRVFESLQPDELSPVVEELASSITKAYDSPSSTVRKTAVYCLVAMVNKLGMKIMEPHLQKLSSGKLNLIQVYVNRAMSSSVHSHV